VIFNNKREELISQVAKLEGVNALLLAQLSDARVEKEKLQDQIIELQKALIAKTSPEYYRDNKYAEYLKNPQLAVDAKRERDTNNILSEYARLIESDSLITSKDDLEMVFLRGIGTIDPPTSRTPENSES
jgi:septal ring factor EnvC (AmiA/AmiB activator)